MNQCPTSILEFCPKGRVWRRPVLSSVLICSNSGRKASKSLHSSLLATSSTTRFSALERTCLSSVISSEPATSVDRKSTRLNSSHVKISYAVFCLKKKNKSAEITKN